MKRFVVFLAPLIFAIAFTARGEGTNDADIALNEARLHMGSVESAAERVKRLEALVTRFPDYPYRADMLYYIGINDQMLQRYDEAIAAFEAALRAEPDIAKETPIVSYLKALKGRTFTKRATTILIALLLTSLGLALWRLTRADPALLWGRLVACYAATTALWAALVYFLPAWLGQPRTGLELFPKPVLSNFGVGQMGDAPLRALLLYGAGAILATLPIVTALSTLKKRPARAILAVLGVATVAGSIMGLFCLRYCYADARYDAGSKRVFFMIKNIATKEDVPDEMLPLYDKDFRQRIMTERHKAE